MYTSTLFKDIINHVNFLTLMFYPRCWYTLLILAYVNNIYQIIAHIQTGIKFLKSSENKTSFWEPHGSQDNQNSRTFITSSIIDLLGWLWMFYMFNIWNPVYMYLAWTHFTVCLLSFYDHNLFQTSYIKTKNITTFSSKVFLYTRVMFVWIDALARAVIIYQYFNYLQNLLVF